MRPGSRQKWHRGNFSYFKMDPDAPWLVSGSSMHDPENSGGQSEFSTMCRGDTFEICSGNSWVGYDCLRNTAHELIIASCRLVDSASEDIYTDDKDPIVVDEDSSNDSDIEMVHETSDGEDLAELHMEQAIAASKLPDGGLNTFEKEMAEGLSKTKASYSYR